MAELGLIYGSDEGNTEGIAYRIQARFGQDACEVFDVADICAADFSRHDRWILGIPTWDFGQIQSDWDEFWGELEDADFTGKTIALFGLGDQFGYGDFFLDAMGMLHDVLKGRGARLIGSWPTTGYEFDASKALAADGKHFVGLGIDEDQQPELTRERLDQWCSQIHHIFDLKSPLQTVSD